ncbi:MAG: hypothetical protein COB38_04555 [Gammaproteobacteria bacterium]|nr:MAG: hypothetical protein COB38_04555 [Gammaproteobacteria bacterium]
MFFLYLKKKKLWQNSLRKVKNRIKKLKDVKRRYSMVKQNLHKLMEEKKELLSELKDSENAPELKNLILGLNAEIIEKAEKYKKIKMELKEKQKAVDDLEKEVKESPVKSQEEAPKNEAEEDWGEKSSEEFSRLKTMNSEQQGLISKLKTELSNFSMDGDAPDETIFPKLEQMLKESETCIQMLESELDIVIAELNKKSILLEESAKQSDTNEGSEDIASMKQQLDDTNAMTMTLMSANGDQSNIISFARNSIASDSLSILSDEVLKIVTGYGLEGSIQMRGKAEKLNQSTNDLVSESQMLLLEDDLNGERFLLEGSRLVIRFDKISLLVLGMPKEDEDTCSRYRDSLAIILELANDSMCSIEDGHAMNSQQEVLKKVISTTQSTLENVEQQFKDQATQSQVIINSMTDVLGNPTFVKEMSESFRPIYQGIVEETKERFDKLHEETAAVDASFAKIISDLSKRI